MKDKRKRFMVVDNLNGNVLASCLAIDEKEARIKLNYFITTHPSYDLVSENI